MCIHWVDDIVSAVISTLLAIFISKYFYKKANRDAAKNDILNPLSRITENDNIVAAIEQCKKLYSYRFLTKKEKRAIGALLSAAENYRNHSYEKSFSNAILNFFFQYCGEQRFHTEYSEEAGESTLSPNYDEGNLHLEKYACQFDNDGFFNHNCQEEILERLTLFYKDEMKGEKDISRLFGDRSIEEIINNSNDYSQHNSAITELRTNIDKIKKFVN